MMGIRRLGGRYMRLCATAALFSSMLTAAAALVAPTQAGAAATYNLIKTSHFSGSPAAGWSTCQHKVVTLPKLASSNRYAWSEVFPQDTSDALTNYHQTFHGKFYWTVCVRSLKGQSSHWTYFEYSLLTGETPACETQGHCTTYALEHHFLRVSGGNEEWGSQLFVRPASWCTFNMCESQAKVVVTRT